MDRTLTCLICKADLEHKPIINISDDENLLLGLTSKCVKFQSGLQLLCKQLNISVTNISNLYTPSFVEKIIGNIDTNDCAAITNGIPCCAKCFSVCEEMLRLKQAIKEIEANLKEEVNKLTRLIGNSIGENWESPSESLDNLDILEQIRLELVKYTTAVQNHKLLSKEYQPCYVLLERMPVNQLNTLLKPKESNTITPTNFAFNKDSDQSDLNNDTDNEDDTFVPSPEPLSETDLDENYDDPLNSTVDKFSGTTQIKVENSPFQVTKAVSLTTQKPTKTQKRPKPKYRFYLINDHTLLCKYTLVQVTHGATQFTCKEPGCHQTYKDHNWNTLFEQMRTHIEASHNSPSSVLKTCPLCPNPETSPTFTDGKLFREHLVFPGSHSITKIVCEYCWKPISCRSDHYQKHLCLHNPDFERTSYRWSYKRSGRYQFKCRHCEKIFSSENYLTRHQVVHLPSDQRKKYVCSQCPSVFLCPASFQRHVEIKHEKELLKYTTCPICGKQFPCKYYGSFTSHMKIHRNDRPFVCETCGKGFTTGAEMRKHQKKVHGVDNTIFQCELCPKSFKCRVYLTRHIKICHGNKYRVKDNKDETIIIGPKLKYPCTKCEKVFNHKSNLYQHLKTVCKDVK